MRIFRKTYLFTLCFFGVLSGLVGRASLVQESLHGLEGDTARGVASFSSNSSESGDEGFYSDGNGSPPYKGALEIDWSKVKRPTGMTMGALGFGGSFKKKPSAKAQEVS
ncbi:hypothetical protein OAN21_02600 [Alphaproteobacteria bacterium]|nr:hypothetical protein [Alphaproteobacteria bacterium]